MVQWLALSPHSKKVQGSNPSQDVSVWSLHAFPVSAWFYSGFLPQSKNIEAGGKLIGDSKLPEGVNVSVGGCSSLNVSPVMMNWQLVQVVPRPMTLG